MAWIKNKEVRHLLGFVVFLLIVIAMYFVIVLLAIKFGDPESSNALFRPVNGLLGTLT